MTPSFDQARPSIAQKLQTDKNQAALKQEMDKYKLDVRDPDFFNITKTPSLMSPSSQNPGSSAPTASKPADIEASFELAGAISARSRNLLLSTWTGLPLEPSSPVQLAFLPELTAHRGKLLSRAGRGTPVYAATFIRQRRIVLETTLLSTPAVLRFIFAHELFHFAWVRLGNKKRAEYSCLLVHEMEQRARGELGESAAVKKAELRDQPEISPGGPLWRDYVCESFCDSAACIFGEGSVHEGVKLAKTWTVMRRDWFLQSLADGRRWAL